MSADHVTKRPGRYFPFRGVAEGRSYMIHRASHTDRPPRVRAGLDRRVSTMCGAELQTVWKEMGDQGGRHEIRGPGRGEDSTVWQSGWLGRASKPVLLFSHRVMSNSVTPWTAARQAFLSFTISRTSLKEMLSNHLILCCPVLLLLPSTFPSIRVFSNESSLCLRVCCGPNVYVKSYPQGHAVRR